MGATSGLGRAVASLLAAKGWRVAAAGRNTDALDQLAQSHPGVVTLPIDVCNDDAPDRLRQLAQSLGGLDVYLHVAGIGLDNPKLDITPELRTVLTNAEGFVRMTVAAYQLLRDQAANGGTGGHIAAITSVAGTNGLALMPAYSATKALQNVYLRALDQRATIEKLPITFGDIRPGWVDTPLINQHKGHPLLMTVDYAAPRIVKAIERRSRVCVVDWRWNLVVGLWRLVPNCLWVKLPIRMEL